jgi:hypothetical protein
MADGEHKEDTRLLVRFFMAREKNEHRSLEEGRDVFEEVENVAIRVPGSRDEVVHIVTDDHRTRFKALYKTWKQDQTAPLVGTPLDQWTQASASFVDEMRLYGVRTVEQLADLTDGVAMTNPGWVTMRTRAQAWLAEAKAEGTVSKYAVENEQLRNELADTKHQMANLAQMVAALQERLTPEMPGARRGRRASSANELTDADMNAISTNAA